METTSQRNRVLEQVIAQKQVITSAKAEQIASRMLARQKRDRHLMLSLGSALENILFLDQTGKVVYCTDTFLGWVGVSDIEVACGSRLEELVAKIPDQQWGPAFFSAVQKATTSGTNETVTAWVGIGDKDDVRKMDISITPMCGEDDFARGTMVLFCDATGAGPAALH